LRHQRRVLIIAAPSERDASLAAQRRALAGWIDGAKDRDLTVVDVIGHAVRGIDDRAATLRRHFDLAEGRFGVVLVGKDGHVALRSGRPVAARHLERTIDAMPMRRAGER